MVDVLTIINGIILALIATFCFNLAIVFQKKGLKEGVPEISFEGGISSILKAFKEFFQNKTWIFGFLLGIIGWFPYVISMGMIGILVVQPIMSVGLIVFVIAVNKLLDEKVSSFELAAIGMLGIAPVLIVIAGITEVKIDLHGFVVPLIIFLAIFLTISAICFIISKKRRGTQSEALFIMFSGAILYAFGAIFTNILAQAFGDAEVGITWYFLFELLFGIFWFDYFHLWLFLSFWGMAFFNVVSVVLYQSAFQKGKAVVMGPILNSFVLVIPIMAGLFVFGQSFENFSLFLVAIVLIFLAIVTLSKFQAEIELIEGPQTDSEKEKKKSL